MKTPGQHKLDAPPRAAATAAAAPDTTPDAGARAPDAVNRLAAGAASLPDAAADRLAAAAASALLARLDLRQKAAQLIMPRIGGEYMTYGDPRYERAARWIRELRVGGLIVSMGPPLEIAAKLNMLQALSEVPLLVAADMENGAGRILTGGVILPYGFENGGGTRFPPLMAVGATGDEAAAWELGRITALEARAAGIHVAFAPVADVNSNPRNPIINTRSYGADPAAVARLVAAHVRGVQTHGALAVAKHFPGHGDTSVDSHEDLPYVGAGRDRLDEVELVPFRAALEAGVAGVMTGHIAFPRLTGSDLPATLNPGLVAELLRGELGFDGLVFTDALDMGGVTRRFGTAAAVVLALRAGVDVLLQPPAGELGLAVDAIAAAVARGELSEARLDESVERLLRAKARLGLLEQAQVPLDRVPAVVGIPPHVAVADETARRSITLLRNEDVLPLRGRVLVIIGTTEYDPLAGAAFVAALGRRLPGLAVLRLDHGRWGDGPAWPPHLEPPDVVVYAPFTRVGSGVDAVAVDEERMARVRRLAAGRPLAVVSFGNPYIVEQFPDAACHAVAWAGWEPLQSAAAVALTGGAYIGGRLPIPLPPLYEAGAGLDLRPAAEAEA